jgi:hypothetical protein
MRRALVLAVPCVLVLAVACNDDASNQFDTQSDQGDTATGTGTPADVPLDTGESADEEGDGDGDPTTGDGDGDPTTGDGDGDTGVPVCGNGTIDLGEQCDGAQLNGISCSDLGYSGGSLGCDPVTCTYDASGCTAGGDGGGGTTG